MKKLYLTNADQKIISGNQDETVHRINTLQIPDLQKVCAHFGTYNAENNKKVFLVNVIIEGDQDPTAKKLDYTLVELPTENCMDGIVPGKITTIHDGRVKTTRLVPHNLDEIDKHIQFETEKMSIDTDMNLGDHMCPTDELMERAKHILEFRNRFTKSSKTC